MNCPVLCLARTTSLKGGLRPDSRASLESVTVRSGSTTRPRCTHSNRQGQQLAVINSLEASSSESQQLGGPSSRLHGCHNALHTMHSR